ncbi:MAG: diguanylate cyclase [Clostridiales bacterium]|nr:diguanylate cyclase [Clostridiales bacterium]
MESKPINDPALRNLERTIRFEFEKIILIMAIVCVSLEVAIFFYYYFTDNVGQPVNTYIEFRILVPLLVNCILYLITRFSNRSETSTDTTKNRIVSFAGLIMCGVIGLAHSYFIPLWVFPLFAIIFCSVFHDGFILFVQAGLSIVFILYCGILHIYDYPDERSYSILCIIIAEVLALGVSFLAFRLEIFNTRLLMIRERNFAGANKFEHGFETDRITGVYSKKYLTESASEILKNTNELDPCGIAILDIDDFKRINDELGNDIGDEVLRTLGQVLQSIIDEDTIVGRYGGDTFVIVFENGTRDENFEVLNQIRKEFAKKKYSFTKESVTISGGHAWFDVTMDLESALKEAGAALSNAKKSGKNMIMTTGESEE